MKIYLIIKYSNTVQIKNSSLIQKIALNKLNCQKNPKYALQFKAISFVSTYMIIAV